MKDLIITLLGTLLITSMLFCKKETVERYINVGRALKREVVADEGRTSANMYKGQMFAVPPTWQASLAPRFSNVNYGSNIQYSIPPVNQLAVNPTNPLSEGGCSATVEKYVPIGNAAAGNAARGMVMAPTQPSAQMSKALFGQNPNAARNAGTTDDAGAVNEQPIVYDRFTFANLKSKYSLGGTDMIRGDLPIVPNTGDWFVSSSNPLTDLRQGAMSIMGGVGNSTDLELKALQAQYSAGMLGKNDFQLSVNPSLAQKALALTNAQGDIQVTAFP